MVDDIKQKLVDYLASHVYARLATITAKDEPLVRTVAYASDGATIYFGSLKTTRKVKDISGNPNVSYAVDENYQDITKIQGIQMEGVATILSEMEDIKKAGMLLKKKFGDIPDLPPDQMILIKVEPKQAFFLDCTKGFTHTDKVVF